MSLGNRIKGAFRNLLIKPDIRGSPLGQKDSLEIREGIEKGKRE